MKVFYSFSGLQLNSSKSEISSTGIKMEDLEKIHQVTGYKLRSLLVKYLRVSSVTMKLTSRDCIALVDNITARITCWSSKLLSYAGRLQLIMAVLFSMQNY